MLPSDLDATHSGTAFRGAVDAVLADLLTEQARLLNDPSISRPLELLRSMVLDGGKRIRATLCYWGWRGAGATGNTQQVVTAAAALELIHACALIQDDIVDRSPTRRNHPTLDRRLAAWHTEHRWRGSAQEFGDAIAIALSDLCMSWASMLIQRYTDDGHTHAIRSIFDQAWTHAVYGGVLEEIAQAANDYVPVRCLNITHYKAGQYACAPPLCVGAVLADAPAELHTAYTVFGIALGEGRQLRDDLLDAFGDPDTTGKPNDDGDLRAGKPTPLVAAALELADQDQATRIRQLYGTAGLSPAGADELRALFRTTGAASAVEELITARLRTALDALQSAPIVPDAAQALEALARTALHRAR
jgi:geranylgeranyl diphosphate synthase, type I